MGLATPFFFALACYWAKHYFHLFLNILLRMIGRTVLQVLVNQAPSFSKSDQLAFLFLLRLLSGPIPLSLAQESSICFFH